jgi:hypothetical protein
MKQKIYILSFNQQVREESTGMADEKNYVGTLLGLDEALRVLPAVEAHVMNVAYQHWQQTVAVEKERQISDAATGLPNSPPDPRDSSVGESASVSS